MNTNFETCKQKSDGYWENSYVLSSFFCFWATPGGAGVPASSVVRAVPCIAQWIMKCQESCT